MYSEQCYLQKFQSATKDRQLFIQIARHNICILTSSFFFFLNTYTITNLWKGITILISEFHTDSSGIATLFRSWGAYLVVIGVKVLQAPLHDMIAIRVLDELQEPRAQRLDNELDLLPCPQALDQLLHCPCPAIELHDHTQFAKKESKFFSISS